MEGTYHHEDHEGNVQYFVRIKGFKSDKPAKHGPGEKTRHLRPSAKRVPHMAFLVNASA